MSMHIPPFFVLAPINLKQCEKERVRKRESISKWQNTTYIPDPPRPSTAMVPPRHRFGGDYGGDRSYEEVITQVLGQRGVRFHENRVFKYIRCGIEF
jgi:hypothetical protein